VARRRYFRGGESTLHFGSQERQRAAHDHPRHRPDTIRGFRYGNFSYEIPLAPGQYELACTLPKSFFAQPIRRWVENLRVFDVFLNSKPLLPFFDIVRGCWRVDTADIRVFENVGPAGDGFLNLEFRSIREAAWLNAIEIIPIQATGAPNRIVTGTPTLRIIEGNLWSIDKYFSAAVRLRMGCRAARGIRSCSPGSAMDTSLIIFRRRGQISVAAALCRDLFGPNNRGKGGIGSRVFNVYCGGTALLRSSISSKRLARAGSREGVS